MAQDYLEQVRPTNLVNIRDNSARGVEILASVTQLQPLVNGLDMDEWHEDIVVYLAGDWELNLEWSGVLQGLRRLANVCAVKMFLAREHL